jgi:NAD(P)-dependent dehydrogenase (short-subunit alcohol dehydrogenase family)
MNCAPRTSIFDLSGEVAVVIGGTGVLGGAIAEGLAAAGATVAVVGRSVRRGGACVERITTAGGKAQFFTADSTSRESVLKAAEEIESRFGSLAILVNGAGGNDPSVTVTPDHPFEKITPEEWRASFDLNLLGGALIPCQIFGPRMVKSGGGSIINIASVSAHIPLSRVVAYSAAKAAVINLTRFLAREWAPHGVRVNSLTPGFFPAEQNSSLLFHEDGTPTARALTILGHTPMNRFGTPEELIGSIIFLSSRAASGFVTGVDIQVDGGFLSQTI